MRSKVRVALVMPVRNEEKSVDSTLEAIFASTRLPDEIVIADGMSTDRTVEKIEAYRNRGVELRVVKNPAMFAGGGRNAGIRNTDCQVILLADFGNVVDPRWVEEMTRPFEEKEGVDIVVGIPLPLVNSEFEHCMAVIHFHENILLSRYTEEQRDALVPKVLLPGGLCIAVTRRIWEAVGGYPEWLHKAQDKLFSRKAYCLGARIVIAWNAHIHHHMRRTAGEVFKMFLLYGRGNGQSRYLRKRIFKIAGFYALLLSLTVVSAAAWPAGVAVVALWAAYSWKAGFRKIIRVDGGLRRYCYLWQVPAIRLAEDIGTVLGHLVGWCEWVLIPRYRRLFREYTKDCDKRLLFVIER